MIELEKPELTEDEKRSIGSMIQNPLFRKFLQVMKADQVEQIAKCAKNVDQYKLQRIGEACSLLEVIEKLDETMKVYINIIPDNS